MRGEDSSRHFWLGLIYGVLLLILAMRINGTTYQGPFTPLAIGSAPVSTAALLLARLGVAGDVIVFPAMWLAGVLLWPALSVMLSQRRWRWAFAGALLLHYASAAAAILITIDFTRRWPVPELARVERAAGELLPFAVLYLTGQAYLWWTYVASADRNRGVARAA